jgi:hypothetical protein
MNVRCTVETIIAENYSNFTRAVSELRIHVMIPACRLTISRVEDVCVANGAYHLSSGGSVCGEWGLPSLEWRKCVWQMVLLSSLVLSAD